jgi:uncharacterized membrane protein YbhN (UPF0104 family)
MIPGGLGLTELTLDGLLSLRMSVADSTAATILMRLATLWFAVCLGAAVLALTGRPPSRPEESAESLACGGGSPSRDGTP